MRLLTIIILHLLPVTFLYNASAQQPQPVYGIAKQQQPAEWYISQAALWKKETEKTPSNATAWKYYYQANRNLLVTSNETRSMVNGMTDSLAGIVEKMGKAIPDSYEYNYIVYYNGSYKGDREKYFKYLLKAYSIDSTRPDIYDDLVVYAESHGDDKARKRYIAKYYNAGQITPGHLNWCYNLLMSVDKNAVLFTGGDNDTYPVWALQDVKGIRRDVKMINLSLFMMDEYRKIICKELGISFIEIDAAKYKTYAEMLNNIGEQIIHAIANRPVYFAESAGQDYYKKFEDSMYLEGLALRFSPGKYDNVAVLKKNVEDKFMLDYLKVDFTSEVSAALVAYCNTNYIAPFITLYDYYNGKGEKANAGRYKELILAIAEKANMKDEVMEYFKKQ